MVTTVYWWMFPDRNPYMLPVIAVASYIGMAWYDKYYHCDTGVPSDSEPPTAINADRASYLRWVYFLHVLVVGPLLVYLGYKGANADPRAFGAVLALGIIAALYHAIKLFGELKRSDPEV